MLLDTVKQDRTAARLAGNNNLSSVLGVLIGEAQTQSTRKNVPITDDLIISISKRIIENNDATLALTIGSNMPNVFLIQSLKDENVALSKYLPTMLTEQELRKIISETNATNLGEVMGFLKTHYAGRYDGKVASGLAKELF